MSFRFHHLRAKSEPVKMRTLEHMAPEKQVAMHEQAFKILQEEFYYEIRKVQAIAKRKH